GWRSAPMAELSVNAVAERARANVVDQREPSRCEIAGQLGRLEAERVRLARAANRRQGLPRSRERRGSVEHRPMDVREDHLAASRRAAGDVAKQGIDVRGGQIVRDALADEERPD